MANIFQSKKLRSLFLRASKKVTSTPKITGLQNVKEVKNREFSPEYFNSLTYNKEPLLIRGLASSDKSHPIINHEYLIKNYGGLKTTPRSGENKLSKERRIQEILTEKNPKNHETIASTSLAEQKELQKDIDIQDWIPDQNILKSPLLKNTLFVSSEGFYTRLHMEAGRLLNIQLSGKKTWYLVAPKYSHILEPLLSDTTIHFSDVVTKISDIEERLSTRIPIYTCTLEKGDVLLIPPYFWHTVFCKEKAVSMTYQWLTLFKPFFENPFMSLFLLTSRNPSIFDALQKRRRK